MTCPKCHAPMFGDYCICGHRNLRGVKHADKCPRCGVSMENGKCALCDSPLGEIFGLKRDK